MSSLKEIVTKAVVSKGKKKFLNTYTLTPTNLPTTILGCWVINHVFDGYKKGDNIGIDGSFDINIWYSYDNDSKTAVLNEKIDYKELFSLPLKEEIKTDNDIIVRSLSGPNCMDVKIDGGNVTFTIEKEMGVEIVGEKKMRIAIEEEEDEWQELQEVEDEISKIDNEVEENYIEKIDE